MERTELAKCIRELRENYYHESQEEFAERLKISRVTITRYETGDRLPKKAILETLYTLAVERGFQDGVRLFNRGTVSRPVSDEKVDVLPFEVLINLVRYWNETTKFLDGSNPDVRTLAEKIDSSLRVLIAQLGPHDA